MSSGEIYNPGISSTVANRAFNGETVKEGTRTPKFVVVQYGNSPRVDVVVRGEGKDYDGDGSPDTLIAAGHGSSSENRPSGESSREYQRALTGLYNVDFDQIQRGGGTGHGRGYFGLRHATNSSFNIYVSENLTKDIDRSPLKSHILSVDHNLFLEMAGQVSASDADNILGEISKLKDYEKETLSELITHLSTLKERTKQSNDLYSKRETLIAEKGSAEEISRLYNRILQLNTEIIMLSDRIKSSLDEHREEISVLGTLLDEITQYQVNPGDRAEIIHVQPK